MLYCENNNLKRNSVDLIVRQDVAQAVMGYNPKSNQIIPISYHGKPINITTIQVYVPTTDAEEANFNASAHEETGTH